jgi:hypothetical protein
MAHATRALYDRLIAERPEKLTPEQAAYRRSDKAGYNCSGCLHMYHGQVARRNVCEVVRPANDESIKPDWVCDFWTMTGARFPLFPRRGD